MLFADIDEIIDGTGADKDTNVPTNADRIRAMTDEELADYLHEEPWRCVIGKPCTKCERLVDGRCIPIAEWLQQQAEDK